jgi:hypothetical protein
VLAPELLGHGALVARRGPPQPRQRIGVERGVPAQLVEQGEDALVGHGPDLADRVPLAEAHQRGHVARPARLDSGPHGALGHAAEGLAQHDGTRGAPVHVEIAGAHPPRPVLLLPVVEAV